MDVTTTTWSVIRAWPASRGEET